jgi:predicted acetyltransferase
MITYAADNQKQDIIASWKTAFPSDSEAFVNFYFEKKYRNKNSLLYFKDDKIASCLQMLPYKMTYYEHLINTSYISGAMTLPQYRNQGLMKCLFVHAFKEMKKRKNTLTTLIPQNPWLIAFYKHLGYTPCFEYELTPINPDDYPLFPDKMRFKEFQPADLKRAYGCYRKYFEKQNVCVQKSLVDFAIMAEECQRFEGNVYVLIDKGETVGVCFCFFTKRKIILKDCIANNEFYRQYFLSKLIQQFKAQFNTLEIAEVKQGLAPTHEIGMARILDAHKLLQLFAKSHPHLNFSAKINDKHIAENNLTFVLSNGTVIVRLTNTADFELSIGKLTQLLLGYQISSLEEKYAIFPQQHPYMSLMLE